jgi:hypothetical protein
LFRRDRFFDASSSVTARTLKDELRVGEQAVRVGAACVCLLDARVAVLRAGQCGVNVPFSDV